VASLTNEAVLDIQHAVLARMNEKAREFDMTTQDVMVQLVSLFVIWSLTAASQDAQLRDHLHQLLDEAFTHYEDQLRTTGSVN
jgi:macrodomain Ter protein organizer (MatP/YcbG family)